MGPLDIGAANDLDGLHDPIGLLLQPFLHVLRDGQHGSRAERVTGVDTQRVNIFNEADGDHIAVLIAHHFQFQLFPT